MSAFRSEGRWAPHTTRSWQFLGFEEGIKEPDDSDWLPSLDKSSADVIVGVLDSGELAACSLQSPYVMLFFFEHAITFGGCHVWLRVTSKFHKKTNGCMQY